jgi:hypothetical protein
MSIEINITDNIVEVTPTEQQVDINITENPIEVNVTDAIIVVAQTGLPGPQGPAGPGIAVGGTAGQILAKNSSTNYDTLWINAGVGTVTSINASGVSGISVSGGPITSSGTLLITNTAPDQVVSLTGTGTTSISGTYPNFTINSEDQFDGTVTSVGLISGTGIAVSGGPVTSSGNITVTNTAPDQIVSLTGTGTTSISGTYPSFTINSVDSNVGTVTSIATSAPITGGTITASGTIGITQSSASGDGYLSSTDWTTFNGKQGALTLTTTGTSGAATLIGNTLNVPQYEAEGNYVTTATTLTINGTTYDLSANRSWSVGTVTSVGLSMPVAFSVSNTPITSSGTLAVTAVGTSSQYIRGDGQLATLPSGSSGGSSVNYYLNGSVAASVAGYQQMSNSAVIGAGTDFALVGNGLIAQFLTDVANPNRLLIPGGAWNFEMYFNMSSSGGNAKFYVELLKYDGTTFTSIASSSAVAEEITGGTTIDLYLTSLAVPETVLLTSDRLAIRVYIVDNSGGRTARLHTENSHLCEIITTFAGGIAALNGLTANTQYLAVGTAGTDFAISSLTDIHTFNLPTASATNRGALSSADWSTFNSKEGAITAGTTLQYFRGDKTFQTLDTLAVPENTNLYFTGDRVRTTLLTGLNLASGGTIAATDDVLVAFGKVQNQISALVGGVNYDGTWNASTNSPTIVSGTGNKGDYYVVSTAGSTNIDGITDWKIGDWIIFNGTVWDKVDNTDAVSSVNGYTGAVSLVTGDVLEGTGSLPSRPSQLYFTDARARSALSAGTGISYNSTTGVITNSSPDQTVSITAGSGISVSGTYPSFTVASTITQYTDALARAAVSLTVSGASGASTYNSTTGVLNVPTYTLSGLGGVPTTRSITINGTAQDLSADRTFSVGTVTSVGLSSVTSGVTIGSTPVTTSGTITLAIATASGSQNGLLSSTDWTTFNGKQNALTNPVTGTGTTNYLPKFTGASAIGDSIISESGTIITVAGNINVGSLGNLAINAGSSATPLLTQSTNYTELYRRSGGVGIYLGGTGDPANYYDNTSHFFRSSAGGSTYLTINSSGNLSLGVTPSAWSLGKAIEIGNIGNSVWGVNATQFNVLQNVYYDGGGFKYASTNAASYYQQISGAHAWYTAPSGTAGNAITFTTAMILDASGSLLIGASGTVGVKYISITPSSTTTPTVIQGAHAGVGAYAIAMQSGGGNLLVGTTTDAGYKLDVNGTGRFSGALTGTSATFSGRIGTSLSSSGINFNNSSFYVNNTANTKGAIFGYNDTNDNFYFTALEYGVAYKPILFNTSAATFSSSVTTGGFVYANGNLATANGNQSANSTSATLFLGNRGYFTSPDVGAATIRAISTGSFWYSRTDLSFSTNPGPDVTSTSAVERMRITGDGNVGIGTASPNIGSVTGTVLTINGSVQSNLEMASAGVSRARIASSSSDTTIETRTALPLVFGTNSTEKMRITSGGNVLIGTTTDNGTDRLQVSGNGYVSGSLGVGITPSYPLHIRLNTNSTTKSTLLSQEVYSSASGYTDYFRFEVGANSSRGGRIIFGETGGGFSDSYIEFALNATNIYQSGNNPITFTTNNIERLRVTGGGEILVGNTDNGAYNLQCNGTGVWGAGAYVNGSDINLKDNITDINNALDLVLKIQPKTFTYKPDYSKDQSIQTGFIAQQLINVLKDEVYLDGIVKMGNEHYNVAYQNLIPLLVKAIQEQQIQIEQLKNR